MKEQMNFCVLALQNEIDSKPLFYILCCVLSHSFVSDSLQPHDCIAHQAHVSVGIFQARTLDGVAMLSSMLSFPTFEVS